jgi:putative FmdB family regulatory protein
MPTYGYRCTACEHTFERFQKMTDPAVTECESCGGLVKKMLYPVGIAFKGSGFYVNDYSKSPAKSSGDGNGSSETKSEAKPETKTETPAPAPAASSTTATESKPAATTAS